MHAFARGIVAALFISLIPMTTTAQDTLFDRLGGLPAIEAVVDQGLANIVVDDRINGFFAGADAGRLRGLLVEQICQASGGPCTYSGRPMPDAHAGLGIRDEHFNALVEDLGAALNTLNVPAAEQGELAAILESLRPQVVGVPAAAPSAPAAPPAPPAQPAAPAAVTIAEFNFTPATVTIGVGGSVTWTNRGQVPHTATGSGFDTGRLNGGQASTQVFASAGRFDYACAIHSSMRGTVVVQ